MGIGVVAITFFTHGSLKLRDTQRMTISEYEFKENSKLEKRKNVSIEDEYDKMMEQTDLSAWESKPIPKTKAELDWEAQMKAELGEA